MSLIRGVLLCGRFRTQAELTRMSPEDQRNTLIVELTKHSNQTNYQSYDDTALAGMGAVMAFLREARIRDDEGLKRMSADDQRNTLIVEMATTTGLGGAQLQALSNIELVALGLGGQVGTSLAASTFLRGVLLAGRFRTHHELNRMSNEDQRNTLIVELTNRSNQSNYQSFDDVTLAGMGALLVFLREAGIRDDATLKTMTSDDQRNTTIVEVDAQTRLGVVLQTLRNMDLIGLALGVDSTTLFRPLPAPLQPVAPQKLQFRLRGFVQYQSTDDTFQGARDEVWISAIGVDSSTAHFGPDGRFVLDEINAPVIGDIADDRVRGPWVENPFVFLEFDLERPGPFPRSYVVTLLVVEEDNEGLMDSFKEVRQLVGKVVRDVIKGAATSAGAIVGTVIMPGIGSAVGAAAGFLVGTGWDEIIGAIADGLNNEVFTPKVVSLFMFGTSPDQRPLELDHVQTIRFQEHGAVYDVVYDWHIEQV